ncbi:unnamed protein product [Prorocentrum cordatum]|uniref:Uncharacterized protein n=1 Tax=Prorocentrum cordatum TaxID=2364126 RepID=A0ABN9R5N3_9DINO|nr:unnamed protein product [Polarella glacialis]
MEYFALFVALPAIGWFGFPAGVAACRSQGLNACLALVAAKRLYIYGLAMLAVLVAARRSTGLPSGLGTRLGLLTEELLRVGEVQPTERAAAAELRELDQASGEAQAAGLPILLSLALAASVGLADLTATGEQSQSLLSSAGFLLSGLTLLSNALFCVLAVKAEASEALAALVPWPAERGPRDLVALALASGLTFLCFTLPLSVLSAALGGIALYDLLGTLGPLLLAKAQGALGVGGAASSAASTASLATGPMAQIALAKAGAVGSAGALPSWRPGLLEVVLNGRLTDILGLADVAFPAALAGWALRADQRSEAGGTSPAYFPAALAGYAAGCAGCEVLGPALGVQGIPALVVIVPAMLGTTLSVAAWRGELAAQWSESELGWSVAAAPSAAAVLAALPACGHGVVASGVGQQREGGDKRELQRPRGAGGGDHPEREQRALPDLRNCAWQRPVHGQVQGGGRPPLPDARPPREDCPQHVHQRAGCYAGVHIDREEEGWRLREMSVAWRADAAAPEAPPDADAEVRRQAFASLSAAQEAVSVRGILDLCGRDEVSHACEAVAAAAVCLIASMDDTVGVSPEAVPPRTWRASRAVLARPGHFTGALRRFPFVVDAGGLPATNVGWSQRCLEAVTSEELLSAEEPLAHHLRRWVAAAWRYWDVGGGAAAWVSDVSLLRPASGTPPPEAAVQPARGGGVRKARRHEPVEGSGHGRAKFWPRESQQQ